MVIKTAGKDVDYTETLRRNFGPRGWIIGMICFCVNLYVPILIFFQLMAQNLFPVLLFIIELFNGDNRSASAFAPDWSEFSYSWTCVIIFLIVFGMTSVRDLKVFVKINSYGVIFIALIILFICGMGIYGYANTDYTTNQQDWDLY